MDIFDKPLFIFEMANNHQGSVAHGKRIIQELKKIIQDYDVFHFAVKFQYRNLETFIHPDYQERMDIKNVKRFKETELSPEQFLELKQEVVKQGMYTICTPFDEESVERISEHDYDAIKIASCSFTDWNLLEKIAKQNKPVIASAAGSTIEDVDRVVSFFAHRHIEFSLLHCVAEYPVATENLQMNQITFYKKRYPGLRIGFSTHESPEDMEPIKVAVAKGAEIFEKHVGLETDTITLNGYSARPEQVENWLKIAKNTFRMCGVLDERYTPSRKEKDDLAALQRGVFAKSNISVGKEINRNTTYLAFPSQKGQLLANHLSKYTNITLKSNPVEPNAPIMLENVIEKDETERIREIGAKAMILLKKSNVVLPLNSICEISHHYGMDLFETTGVTIINCINREYCKKILVVLPGQSHPTHIHKQKEETFTVLYGVLDTVCDGVEKVVNTGESMVVERGVDHSFRSEKGCVFEEISTTHFANDSFYPDEKNFVNPRKTKVYITREMLNDMEL